MIFSDIKKSSVSAEWQFAELEPALAPHFEGPASGPEWRFVSLALEPARLFE